MAIIELSGVKLMNNRQPDERFVLRSSNIHRGFDTPEGRIEVLKGVNLDLIRGEMLVVLGASGVGKTTLLQILGGLDKPDQGNISFNEYDYATMSETDLASFRNAHIGFVFQFHYLMSEFSALENVMMPALIANWPNEKAKKRAELLLTEVGLRDRSGHKPSQLSGGEQQRVAVARALTMEPEVVIADEPSGNLDTATGSELHQLLKKLNREIGTTFLIATHNLPLADLADRVVSLSNEANITDGRLNI